MFSQKKVLLCIAVFLFSAAPLAALQSPAAQRSAAPAGATAEQDSPTLQLAGMFGDHMVLQQNSAAPIWGFAVPGSTVKVIASWSDQPVTAETDEDGNWKVSVQTPAAGGPHQIEIKSGEETKSLKDVLTGEVWICSGQSNMQWKLRGFGVDHFKEDVEKANHPEIRFCQVQQAMALEPADDLNATWSVCSPRSALQFSAVGYFFGNKLHAELDVPIGLISTNWGGSSAQAWTSRETLDEGFPEFRTILESSAKTIEQAGSRFPRGTKAPAGINQRSPSVLYNNMIHPLMPFGIRGVIWYQGESNVERPAQYARLFPEMINSWRQEWSRGDFPFYFVQIAPFQYRDKQLPVALLREAQTAALALPNTGMVVTMDVGDATNIHPKQKKPVGERLALQALVNDYGRQDLVCSGPQYDSFESETNLIRLKFDNPGGGLISRDEKPLSHFTIAGADHVFHNAVATVDGETILVSSENVSEPVAVRFAWGNADQPNLTNDSGLPCASFRTDSWPVAQHSMTDDGRLPNIVLMISDELAYFELSHMGNRKLRTPNIDQMARNGMRFTHALASAPVCGPLRCCLMTGLHTGHSSMRTNGGASPIRADEFTMADMLRQRGYATGGFGKWGIGGRGSTGVPEKHGFDTFFGYYDQVHAHCYFPHHLVRNSVEVKLPGSNGGHTGETYAHHEIMKEGLNFIRENRDRPFFCYLPVTPPHGTFNIPADEPAFDLYKDDPWMNDPEVPQDAKNYAAMVSMLDNDLKRVNDLLKELDLDRDTIVIFSGDNGGEPRFSSETHPHGFFEPNVNPETGVQFRGKKRTLYEGALRIPFIVNWPGRIDAGQVNDHLFYQVDLIETFAEMTGNKPPVKTDGISILPTLLGEEVVGHKQQQHEFFYWEYLKQTAIRKGDFKAVRPEPDKPWQLFNLAEDIGETNNIADDHPDIVEELAKLARESHTPARQGSFHRMDLQKRDREAKWKVPETPIRDPDQPAESGN